MEVRPNEFCPVVSYDVEQEREVVQQLISDTHLLIEMALFFYKEGVSSRAVLKSGVNRMGLNETLLKRVGQESVGDKFLITIDGLESYLRGTMMKALTLDPYGRFSGNALQSYAANASRSTTTKTAGVLALEFASFSTKVPEFLVSLRTSRSSKKQLESKFDKLLGRAGLTVQEVNFLQRLAKRKEGISLETFSASMGLWDLESLNVVLKAEGLKIYEFSGCVFLGDLKGLELGDVNSWEIVDRFKKIFALVPELSFEYFEACQALGLIPQNLGAASYLKDLFSGASKGDTSIGPVKFDEGPGTSRNGKDDLKVFSGARKSLAMVGLGLQFERREDGAYVSLSLDRKESLKDLFAAGDRAEAFIGPALTAEEVLSTQRPIDTDAKVLEHGNRHSSALAVSGDVEVKHFEKIRVSKGAVASGQGERSLKDDNVTTRGVRAFIKKVSGLPRWLKKNDELRREASDLLKSSQVAREKMAEF